MESWLNYLKTAPQEIKLNKSISILHPYLEGRLSDVANKQYPRHHLWGINAIEELNHSDISMIEVKKFKLPKIFERFFNRLILRRSSDVRLELAGLSASTRTDLTYSVCGPLAFARFYKKSRLVSWVFRAPANNPTSTLHPYHNKNLRSHAGFLCLTPKAEKYFSKFAPSKFLPWCVDLDLFDGEPASINPPRPFFLATGKTNRDYETLINGAAVINAELRIIGPEEQRPNQLPSNVNWINTSVDPPDQAIDYATLREWYAQSLAVCIPLKGDANDTCGYTNMLEAMAMRKPVIMTRSGSLHINPKDQNFGFLVEPEDTDGWTHTMEEVLNNPVQNMRMGSEARRIAENDFSIETFEQELLGFLREILA